MLCYLLACEASWIKNRSSRTNLLTLVQFFRTANKRAKNDDGDKKSMENKNMKFKQQESIFVHSHTLCFVTDRHSHTHTHAHFDNIFPPKWRGTTERKQQQKNNKTKHEELKQMPTNTHTKTQNIPNSKAMNDVVQVRVRE